MKLIMLTDDAELSRRAEAAGVDRIFVDLEYINKRERQRGRDTHITSASIEDVSRIRSAVSSAELLVRVNPIHPGSIEEIDNVISRGAEVVMLPMVLDARDVEIFTDAVGGRATTSIMIETPQSLARAGELLRVPGIDEVYIGLNDLHIGLKLDFMFELLTGGLVEYMATQIKACGLPFGFGGIAKIGEGAILSERILAEHVRLGSSMVILSRTFRSSASGSGLEFEIMRIRDVLADIGRWDAVRFEENRTALKRAVDAILRNDSDG